jgi:hypothetical protein
VFEAYMEIAASSAPHKIWMRARKAAARDGRHIWEATLDWLIAAQGQLYVGFVIQTVCGLHRGASAMRFHPTFVSHFHGLSQMGATLMSSMGFMMPSTTYDRAITDVIIAHDEQVRWHCRHAYTHIICEQHLTSLPSG